MEFVDSFQALRSLPITQHSRIWVRSCDIVKYITRSFTANYRFIPVSYMCVSFLLSTSVKVIGESTPSLNSSSVELVCVWKADNVTCFFLWNLRRSSMSNSSKMVKCQRTAIFRCISAVWQMSSQCIVDVRRQLSLLSGDTLCWNLTT